jgi:glycogen operon protein
MADGLLGSPQLFSAADGERPTGSVNYAASHDGSTVRDTVSYTETQPNGGQHSWDCRTSGQADDDPQVLALRSRMQRNLLATAILSQGIPMLLYGDECGRTQGGNDNAYDVDGPTTWMPWGADQDADLLAFTRDVLALRRRHPLLRSPRFFQDGAGGAEFLRPDGQPMAEQDFDATGPCALALLLDGDSDLGVDATGRPVRDESTILLLLNASWDPVSFTLPPAEPDGPWQVAVTTEAAGPTGAAGAGPLVRPGRSLMVLTRPVGKP